MRQSEYSSKPPPPPFPLLSKSSMQRGGAYFRKLMVCGLNGWDVYDSNGWDSYSKVSYCFWDKNTGLQLSKMGVGINEWNYS